MGAVAGVIVGGVVVLIRVVKLERDLLGNIHAVADAGDGLDHVDLLPGSILQHAVINAERLMRGRDAGVHDRDDHTGAVSAELISHRRSADHVRRGIRTGLCHRDAVLGRNENLGNARQRGDGIELGIVHRDGHAVEQRSILEVDLKLHLLFHHHLLDLGMLKDQLGRRIDGTLDGIPVISSRLAVEQDNRSYLIAGLVLPVFSCLKQLSLRVRQIAAQPRTGFCGFCRVCSIHSERGGAQRKYQHESQHDRQPSGLLHVCSPLLSK